MRVDKFSIHTLRESHATIQELTSHIQELQERVNNVNDSRMSRYRIVLQWIITSRSSQPTVVPSPRSLLSRDQSLRSDTWNFVWNTGKLFGNPRAVIDSSQTPYQVILHTNESECYRWNPRRER